MKRIVLGSKGFLIISYAFLLLVQCEAIANPCTKNKSEYTIETAIEDAFLRSYAMKYDHALY